ncbi:hypothetical protein BC827DRAFT_1222997 [Russula dissimulans]|nr:hypothetical protein BC827DRAFT_1222997 [Russula dissimulans]
MPVVLTFFFCLPLRVLIYASFITVFALFLFSFFSHIDYRWALSSDLHFIFHKPFCPCVP